MVLGLVLSLQPSIASFWETKLVGAEYYWFGLFHFRYGFWDFVYAGRTRPLWLDSMNTLDLGSPSSLEPSDNSSLDLNSGEVKLLEDLLEELSLFRVGSYR